MYPAQRQSEHREPHLKNAVSACSPIVSLLMGYDLRRGSRNTGQRVDLGDKQQNLKNSSIWPIISKGNSEEENPSLDFNSCCLQ